MRWDFWTAIVDAFSDDDDEDGHPKKPPHKSHKLKRISVKLVEADGGAPLWRRRRKGRKRPMSLQVLLGAKVNIVIAGHSALNGALIPEGATVTVVSNDPSVATVDPITVPAGGSQTLTAPVTVLATGSTDMHVTVSPADGSGPFEGTATLLVAPVPVPGLAAISVDLVEVPQS